ncbi:MAG: ABC transporter permease [Chloroflexota bacterium]|nr:ABC transporter permease [Chloroflexota bacterium]
MLNATRLTLRLHRFEVVAFVALSLLLTAAAWLVASRLDAVGFSAACIDRTGAGVPPSCERLAQTFYDLASSEASPIQSFIVIVPFIAAILLGVTVVGREVERGTTRLAWSLAPSRRRWLLARLVPIAVLIAVGTYALGVAADRLLGASEPDIDTANAFAMFGFRGVALAARVFFVFALAVLVGTAMGRVMPAVIVAAILAWFGISGGERVHDEILQRETVVVASDAVKTGDRQFDQRFQLPDGSLIGWQEMEQIDPPTGDNWRPKYPMVSLIIPGARYRQVELREVAALAGGTLVAVVATAFVVARRRPS